MRKWGRFKAKGTQDWELLVDGMEPPILCNKLNDHYWWGHQSNIKITSLKNTVVPFTVLQRWSSAWSSVNIMAPASLSVETWTSQEVSCSSVNQAQCYLASVAWKGQILVLSWAKPSLHSSCAVRGDAVLLHISSIHSLLFCIQKTDRAKVVRWQCW